MTAAPTAAPSVALSRGASSRVISIDALRGATVAVMILVNNPGDWGQVYPLLRHAAWNGCTLADLVFPSFLFLMGCAIPLSLDRRIAQGTDRGMLSRQIFRRAALLFALKLLLSAYPYFHLSHLRLYGVLTRIAACYLAVGLFCVWVPARRLLPVAIGVILVGYWLALRYVPIPHAGLPGRDFPLFDARMNLGAWLDRAISAWSLHWLHMGRLYEDGWDPEGALGTLPAIATTMLGVIAGRMLRDGDAPSRRLAVMGVGLLASGAVWGLAFPINKSLWSSSFVLWTGGVSMCVLALFHLAFDTRRVQDRSAMMGRILLVLRILGMNALVAFLFSGFLAKTLMLLPAPGGGSLSDWLYHLACHGAASGMFTSLLFALAFCAACFVPVWGLWRRHMIVRL
ncbi:hypothetical protein CFR73_06995 [Novacetimonas maltaceti]|uniref:Heparan-alpha-glucosaminide N-acetyltransferase catalytic domain-containing protein n=1 Tax=Novacetimonas maltaceti TaxID=1203393 RepID=A0A2S3VZK0_9PROT|nr:DUF5009 domain-containing protein [Novacetimonas maltaceti]POF62040.1 hypothetical protein KMAL_23210 [Novacetimonas maltaceti]PYD60407.1 hypothetical protein CFR73_06995 [Novacetimonas maltaceti]